MNVASKVAYVTNVCSHYRIGLYEKLDQLVSVDFFFFSDGNEWYAEKKHVTKSGRFNVVPLKKSRWFSFFGVIPNLIWRLYTGNYDVYVKCINGKLVLPLVYLTARLRGKPFVLVTGLWMHPKTWIHRLTFPLARYIYLNADAVVVYGQHVKKYLMNIGVSENRIHIGNLAVNNSLFNNPVSSAKKADLKSRYNISHRFVVLFVGRLMPEKGLEYLLEAHRMLKNKLDVALVLIGDGLLRESLKNKARDAVYFLDYIPNDELYTYYAIADVFVLPSVTTPLVKETWGLVINEAMNQGCPIVATDAVGAAAGGLVIEGKNGFIVREADVYALYQAIDKLLQNDLLRSEMALFTKQFISQWSYESMATGYATAIHQVNT